MTTKYESDRLLDGTTAKHLTILFEMSDIGDLETHEVRDKNLLKDLDKDENAHFKDPKTDEDYIGLMRLLAKHSESLMSGEYSREKATEMYFNTYYLDPDEDREETRAEFFKLAKLCLERKKFKPLRNLGKRFHWLFSDNSEKNRR